MEAFEYIDRNNHPKVVQVGMFTHIETMAMAEQLKDGDQFIAIGYPGYYYERWKDFGGKYKAATVSAWISLSSLPSMPQRVRLVPRIGAIYIQRVDLVDTGMNFVGNWKP